MNITKITEKDLYWTMKPIYAHMTKQYQTCDMYALGIAEWDIPTVKEAMEITLERDVYPREIEEMAELLKKAGYEN
jgi:hypothetical protein